MDKFRHPKHTHTHASIYICCCFRCVFFIFYRFVLQMTERKRDDGHREVKMMFRDLCCMLEAASQMQTSRRPLCLRFALEPNSQNCLAVCCVCLAKICFCFVSLMPSHIIKFRRNEKKYSYIEGKNDDTKNSTRYACQRCVFRSFFLPSWQHSHIPILTQHTT